MISLITPRQAQQQIAAHLRDRRLSMGLTQQGLAERSGVSLPTLRKFEQKGVLSLESLLKLAMALDCLGELVKATEPQPLEFQTMDELLKAPEQKKPRRGWRK